MNIDSVEAIKRHPLYGELVCKRKFFAYNLTLAMMVLYFGFILTIAFAPKSLAVPLSPDTVTTVGIPVGLAVIVGAFILTGIYVFRANGEFDAMTQKIREDLQ